jgi:protein SCO1
VRRGRRAHSSRDSLVPLIAAALALLASSGCARRYAVEGLVTAVDPAKGTMTVSHRAVPGLMPAMVMPFHLQKPADAQRIKPGDRVRFELAKSQARKVRVVAARQEFAIPMARGALRLGDSVPDFVLIDQTGSPVRLSDFRGQAVAINFIYTRCPLPDVCPRLAAAFAYAERELRNRPVVFLSVTVDPQHDTPEVLREYAARWRADPERWRFLTGELETVREVAEQFGLAFWPEENMIGHTVTTAVVDPQGRVAALIEGSAYRAAELRDLLAGVSREL